jgi:methionine aminopeptidase
MIADSSKMYLIGDVSPLARQLVKKTYEGMWKGIKAVKPGATLGDIGHAIQSYVESHGYSVVREYCGHGIGKEMHEEPQVLHYGKPGEGTVLKVLITSGLTGMMAGLLVLRRGITITRRSSYWRFRPSRMISCAVS